MQPTLLWCVLTTECHKAARQQWAVQQCMPLSARACFCLRPGQQGPPAARITSTQCTRQPWTAETADFATATFAIVCLAARASYMYLNCMQN